MEEAVTDLWKEASRKLAWAVLSTFSIDDREKVRRWARGVASGMVRRYTTVNGHPAGDRAQRASTPHKLHPIDSGPPSTDNGWAVEGKRLDKGWHPVPTLSGLSFATDRSLWVRERVRVWTEMYGGKVKEEVA